MKTPKPESDKVKFHALMESESFHLFLVLVFALLSVAGVIFWKTDVQSALREDEADLTMQVIRVESFLQEKAKLGKSFDWVFDRMYSDPDIYQDKPPLFYFLFANILRTGFLNSDTLYMFNLLGLFLSILFVFLIGKQLFNSRTGLLAASFWACFPLTLDYARIIEHETLLGFLSPVFVYVFLVANKRSAIGALILCGFLIGILMYIKQTFILYVLGALFFPSLKSLFSDESERTEPNTFSVMFRNHAKSTLFVLCLIVLFSIIRGFQSVNFSGYLLAVVNVVLSGFVIVGCFEWIYRIFKRGDASLWGIIFLLSLIAYNAFVLLPRPQIFGQLLPAYPGLLKNLIADQTVLFNLVALYYLFNFFKKESKTPVSRRFRTGLSLFFYRGFFRSDEHIKIAPFIQFALLFSVVLLVYIPFNNLYINRALLKWAIERQGAYWFGYGIFYPILILLGMSLAQLVIFAYCVRKFKFDDNEKLVFIWFFIPVFSFVFIFYNVETKYIFPALPAFALLVGRIIDQAQSKIPKNSKICTLFLLSCLHLLIVYTVPNFFTSIPGRIFALPALHHQVRADIAAFSRNNDGVKLADDIVHCVAKPETGYLADPVYIDDSVLKQSRLSVEYLNLRLMLLMEGDGNPHTFSTNRIAGALPNYILVRQNSEIASELKSSYLQDKNVGPKCEFSIDVTPDYARLLSIAEGKWLRWKQFRNVYYAIYELHK